MDRFSDHGLVGVVLTRVEGDLLDIDTWLMSCRVIGRTVEQTVLQVLAREAVAHGCRALRGTYIPTAKNGLVADLYPRLGFTRTQQDGETTVWELAVDPEDLPHNDHIELDLELAVPHELHLAEAHSDA